MATDANSQAVVNNAGEPTEKVTFDERQQQRVNELIAEKQGEAARAVRAELVEANKRLSSLEAELVAAKEAVKHAPNSAAKQDAQDDVSALRAEIAEARRIAKQAAEEVDGYKRALSDKDKLINEAKQETMKLRKTHTLNRAAEKVGFVDVEDVIRLTNDCVVWSDERSRFVVVDPENGAERRNSAFELMSVEEFYNEYASKKPHLVRTDMRGGAGSSEGSKTLTMNGKYSLENLFGKNADAKLANELAQNDINRYRAEKARAREAGLI